MPPRRVLLVPLAALAVTAAGCGSSGSTASSPTTVVPSSGTIAHAPVATAPPASTTTTAPAADSSPTTATGTSPKPSTIVTVPGSGAYVLSARADAGTGPCVTPGLAGTNVPFTVSVSNHGTASEPLARVAVAIADPKATTTQPVAALSYSGLCTNFTEPGGTLAAGQTVTYDGSASGVSSAAVLNVTVISTPANNTLGQISVPLG